MRTTWLQRLVLALFLALFFGGSFAACTPAEETTDDVAGDDDDDDDTDLSAQEIASPCGNYITYTMKFISSTEAYAGCANGDTGMVMSSTDAGATWTEVTAFTGMRTYFIETDAADRIYFCGVDNGTFLYRADGGVVTDLLNSDNTGSLTMTACENVAVVDPTDDGDSSDTIIVVEGLAGQTLWLSEDNGATWEDTYYWEESALDFDDADNTEDECNDDLNNEVCKGFQITDLFFVNDSGDVSLYATGSTETENPKYFIPSEIGIGDTVDSGEGSYFGLGSDHGNDHVANRAATLINLKETDVTTDFIGEARFLLPLDSHGSVLLTGGRMEGEDADTIWIAKSADGGANWDLSTTPTITDTGTFGNYDIVTDASCHSDGDVCLASVLRYPFEGYGSAIFASVDAGETWVEYTGEFDVTDTELWTVVWNGDDWIISGYGDVAVAGTLEDITSF